MGYDNSTIARRFIDEVFSKGNFAVLDEIAAKDVVWRDLVLPQGTGYDHIKNMVTPFRMAFPDLTCTCDEVLVAGDRVICKWTARGTNLAPLMGLPATNR